jgi:hypothetical protein
LLAHRPHSRFEGFHVIHVFKASLCKGKRPPIVRNIVVMDGSFSLFKMLAVALSGMLISIARACCSNFLTWRQRGWFAGKPLAPLDRHHLTMTKAWAAQLHYSLRDVVESAAAEFGMVVDVGSLQPNQPGV